MFIFIHYSSDVYKYVQNIRPLWDFEVNNNDNNIITTTNNKNSKILCWKTNIDLECLVLYSAPFLIRPPQRFLLDLVILHTHLHNLCDLNVQLGERMGIIREMGRPSKPVLSPKPNYRQVASFSLPDELLLFNQIFSTDSVNMNTWPQVSYWGRVATTVDRLTLRSFGPGRLLGWILSTDSVNMNTWPQVSYPGWATTTVDRLTLKSFCPAPIKYRTQVGLLLLLTVWR